MNESIEFIDQYCRGAWSRVKDPFMDPEMDLSKQVEAAGFYSFDTIGEDRSSTFFLEIYANKSHDRGWLAVLNTSTNWHPILVDDFPSMVMLIKELSPWITGGHQTHILDIIEEFRELLIGYRRTVGPLAECLDEYRKQQRHDAQTAKAAQEARAAKIAAELQFESAVQTAKAARAAKIAAKKPDIGG